MSDDDGECIRREANRFTVDMFDRLNAKVSALESELEAARAIAATANERVAVAERRAADVAEAARTITTLTIAAQLGQLNYDRIADAIFGDERSPMQWHHDVVHDVLIVIVAMLCGRVPPNNGRVLPVDPHPIEDSRWAKGDK